MSSAEPAAPADHAFQLVQRPQDGLRVATLVYRESGRALAVELERSAAPSADWLARDCEFCVWSDPPGLALEPEHTDRVLARLEAWSTAAGVRIEIGAGVDPLVDLMARGFTLVRHPEGGFTATPPPSQGRGFFSTLFRR
ncbi:MAG: hypothetical protein ABL998_05830 [Planctomycetota bacterium]